MDSTAAASDWQPFGLVAGALGFSKPFESYNVLDLSHPRSQRPLYMLWHGIDILVRHSQSCCLVRDQGL